WRFAQSVFHCRVQRIDPFLASHHSGLKFHRKPLRTGGPRDSSPSLPSHLGSHSVLPSMNNRIAGAPPATRAVHAKCSLSKESRLDTKVRPGETGSRANARPPRRTAAPANAVDLVHKCRDVKDGNGTAPRVRRANICLGLPSRRVV